MDDKNELFAINQASLGEIAYEKISGAIISGAFKSGEKLTIRGLADLLEISSTPVRDAVKRLLLEGALEQRAPRDVRVPVITAEHYRQIVDIRLELEGLAAARAAERRSADDLEFLHRNIEENEVALRKRDWKRGMELNKQFHFALGEAARMPVLLKHLGSLWLQIGPPVSAFYAHGGRKMIECHYDVVKAIEKRDSKEARRQIVLDISGSVEAIIANLASTHR
ncbi:GntR family transcriptional regulator [Pseudohalocynthiibacter aestuariivivens]|uniref:GntR family transcriptional regulator n=1 Tax=Roseovarius pelagicus TaxID=2980108 RepID=A0ABY6D803_9RHOB|nr:MULTISPECIES: GntR family transcriptional regulator [Rhodobacterales]QIE45986.1 GntR family transcriptional regulator [Pseudohalocynthiibacter aestuariivivens]UXX82039.1 GntR family transcriptional regulator [Roseovarius pelagicus]